MFDRKKYKNFALRQLRGRWGVAILMVVVMLLVPIIMSFINYLKIKPLIQDYINQIFLSGGAVAQDEVLDFYYSIMGVVNSKGMILLSLLNAFLLTPIFSFAALKVFIVMTRSPEPVSFKLFIEAMNDWKRGLGTFFYFYFRIILWALIPAAILVAMVLSVIFVYETEVSALTIILILIVLILLFIASYVLLFVKALEYSLTVFISAEFENLPIRKCLKLSSIVTNGHKWHLFVLELSFLGWIILNVFTLCALSLWLTPYMFMTYINAFHALMQEAFETGKVKPEEISKNGEE